MPTTPRLPSIGDEADRLEAALRQARLPLDQEIGVWSVYGDSGLTAAEHALTALKEARSPELVRRFKDRGETPAELGRRIGQQAVERFKAAPPVDVIDQAIERGRLTATEAAKNGPDATIAKEIEQFFTALAQKYGVAGGLGGAGGKLTDSGDQSKPVAKKAGPPSLKDMLDSAAEQLRRNGGYH